MALSPNQRNLLARIASVDPRHGRVVDLRGPDATDLWALLSDGLVIQVGPAEVPASGKVPLRATRRGRDRAAERVREQLRQLPGDGTLARALLTITSQRGEW